MTQTSATQQATQSATEKTAIRPFQIPIASDTELTELRERINATRWPERETVQDQSQGVQLTTMQNLARYWATDYDWRKCEARLNALPNFKTEIDGLVGSVLLVRLITNLLFGTAPLDPLTFVAVPLLLAAVALVASYIPARRAARIDPMVALRCE